MPDGVHGTSFCARAGGCERRVREEARSVLELTDARSRDRRRRRTNRREATYRGDLLDGRHARRADTQQRLHRNDVLLGREPAELKRLRWLERRPPISGRTAW